MSRGSEELEARGLNREEAEAVAVSERVGLITGGGAERISRGYLHTKHPETGSDVVFVPGEALPNWAVRIQNEQAASRLRPREAAPNPEAGGQKAVRRSGGKTPKEGMA